jgi:hypothetical protein
MARSKRPSTRPPAPRVKELHFSATETENDPEANEFIEKANNILQCRLRDFQIAGGNALRRKIDLFVRGGTGCGKSNVFLSLIAAKPNATVLILVPLLAIMEDQVRTSYFCQLRARPTELF